MNSQEEPVWYGMMGSWGDALINYGFAKWDSAQRGEDSFGVLYIGKERAIADWLLLQPRVQSVWHVPMGRRRDYLRLYNRWFARYPGETAYQVLEKYAGHTGIDFRALRHLPMGLYFHPLCPMPRDYEPVLPEWPRAWAKSVAKSLRSIAPSHKLVVFHPYSLNSTKLEAHWPHWHEAWDLLCKRDTYAVLTGLKTQTARDAFRLPLFTADARGRTETMMHLFALCDEADYIVTTSNSLSHWGALRGKPTLVCANRAHSSRSYYFRRWNEVPMTHYVNFNEGLGAFEAALERVERGERRPREQWLDASLTAQAKF